MDKLNLNGTEAAPAKVNLSLEVLERRPDNYHNIKSLMVTVDLCDQLSLFLHSDGQSNWSVSGDHPSLPQDEKNIAYTAARAFFDWHRINPADYSLQLKIKKNIPDQAGLGGGSADAAATIRLLERAFFPDGKFEPVPAAYMAHKIGADVPYCYKGGTQFVSGIGEVMTELEPFPQLPLLLIKPPFNVSTKEAFAALDRNKSGSPGTELQAILQAYGKILSSRRYSEFNGILENSFLPYLREVYPETEDFLLALRQSGSIYASLTGSGPTVFALYEENCDLSKKAGLLQELFPQSLVFETTIL